MVPTTSAATASQVTRCRGHDRQRNADDDPRPAPTAARRIIRRASAADAAGPARPGPTSSGSTPSQSTMVSPRRRSSVELRRGAQGPEPRGDVGDAGPAGRAARAATGDTAMTTRSKRRAARSVAARTKRAVQQRAERQDQGLGRQDARGIETRASRVTYVKTTEASSSVSEQALQLRAAGARLHPAQAGRRTRSARPDPSGRDTPTPAWPPPARRRPRPCRRSDPRPDSVSSNSTTSALRSW